MNSSSLHQARKKKHAGHPNSVSAESASASPFALIRSSAIGFGCTVGVGLLFLLIAALIAHTSHDPNAIAASLAYAALYTTALFAGIITVRIHGHSALLCGLISGALLLLAGLLVAACLSADPMLQSTHVLLLRLPVPLLSVAGAYLARKRHKSRSHTHRPR